METPFLAPWRLLLRNMYGYDPNLYSVPNIIVKLYKEVVDVLIKKFA
jgi:hypothetical protein